MFFHSTGHVFSGSVFQAPWAHPQLILMFTLDSSSQNQNYSKSKTWLPKHGPYPGIQGSWMLGFTACCNPLQPLPIGSEPPTCSIKPDYSCCLNASSAKGSPIQPQRLTTKHCLVSEASLGPSGENQNPFSCPPLGFRSLPSSLYL